MTSYTQSWYTEPRSRTGSRERLTQDDIDQLGDSVNEQSTVTPDGDQQAQSFMQGRLNKTKNEFNFQPTLK